MNNQYFVILYSKYSNVCKKFMNDIKNAQLDFNFNTVCVDNKQIRDKILNSSDFDINSLPCLLILNDNQTNIDKYEGQDAFIWLNDIILQKKEMMLIEKQKQQVHLENLLQESFNKPSSSVNDSNDISGNHTSLDDLDGELDDSHLDETYSKLTTITNNGSSGNETGDKKRPEQLKRDNLMSAALQMQKSREIEDKSINKKNPNL